MPARMLETSTNEEAPMPSTIRLIAALAAVAALLVSATPSLARKGGDDRRITRSGDCTAGSNWKLKAKPDDGRIETEFEVDQNRNGVRWKVTMRRNGRLIANTTRVTKAPSGSFEVSRRPANLRGKDRISAVAKRRGETCRASLSI
jgi:hypothetical protein